MQLCIKMDIKTDLKNNCKVNLEYLKCKNLNINYLFNKLLFNLKKI